VLDVACGPGTLALRLAHHAAQVHGIDFSESMLAVFRNKIEQTGHRNIALHCGDAQTLPYADATFDAAFSLFGLMFFPGRLLAFPVGSTVEFWDHMIKGSAPIQMMKKGLGEALWRKKEKLALAWLEETLPTLKRPLTSDAWLGGK
jgi:SAM-dependent methyltransferase